MKHFNTVVILLITTGVAYTQPDLTLWITPDGYHGDHQHDASQQYFCDGSYYVFYHTDPDTVFVTAKNEGTEALELTAANTHEIAGAHFETVGFSSQILQPGEMYTIKVLYQLPSTYLNGINGHISVSTNDPVKPNCTLYFDVGCFVEWNFRVNDFAGVDGSCKTPIVWTEESGVLGNANIMFDDSLSFYAYNPTPDTAFKIMEINQYGVVMRNDVIAYDYFYAGLTGNGSESVFSVDNFGVGVSEYLNVNAKLHVVDILDADGGISCAGGLGVDGNTNLDGQLTVTGNASVEGTLEVNTMTTPSDIRLKKEISEIPASLQKIMQLKPKTYYLKDKASNGLRQYGFIAQELEAILPEMVHNNAEGMKSVNYQQLIPLLTAALQEQQATIERLEKRLADLE